MTRMLDSFGRLPDRRTSRAEIDTVSSSRPGRPIRCRPMPPLITREEALELGRLTDPADVEALVERAWRARGERFGDSTDMCSLVNAKSGGGAEERGFCAPSRSPDAPTPPPPM